MGSTWEILCFYMQQVEVDGFDFVFSATSLFQQGTLLLALFRAEGWGPSCELAAARGLWLLSRVTPWLCLPLPLPCGCSVPSVAWGLSSDRAQAGTVLVREW